MLKETIAKLNFFKDLSSVELERLSNISYIKRYRSNYLLYYENSKQSRVLFLIDGLAKAYKIDKYQNEIFLYYVYSGEMLSEISTLMGESTLPYSNIELVEESSILSIDYTQFKREFLDTKLLCLEVAKETIRQSKQLQDLVNREFIFDSVSKVAIMLVTNLKMFNRLKRYDVSLMLHIQPSTLSRVLNRLKRNGLIDIVKGEVTILNMEELKGIYNE